MFNLSTHTINISPRMIWRGMCTLIEDYKSKILNLIKHVGITF